MLQQDISNTVLLPCPFADYQTQLLREPWQAGGEAPQTSSCRRWVEQDVMVQKAEKLVSLRSGNMLILLKKKKTTKKRWSTSKAREAVTYTPTSTPGWLQSLVKSVERLPVT